MIEGTIRRDGHQVGTVNNREIRSTLDTAILKVVEETKIMQLRSQPYNQIVFS